MEWRPWGSGLPWRKENIAQQLVETGWTARSRCHRWASKQAVAKARRAEKVLHIKCLVYLDLGNREMGASMPPLGGLSLARPYPQSEMMLALEPIPLASRMCLDNSKTSLTDLEKLTRPRMCRKKSGGRGKNLVGGVVAADILRQWLIRLMRVLCRCVFISEHASSPMDLELLRPILATPPSCSQ